MEKAKAIAKAIRVAFESLFKVEKTSGLPLTFPQTFT